MQSVDWNWDTFFTRLYMNNLISYYFVALITSIRRVSGWFSNVYLENVSLNYIYQVDILDVFAALGKSFFELFLTISIFIVLLWIKNSKQKGNLFILESRNIGLKQLY
jgi:hypothetical protein